MAINLIVLGITLLLAGICAAWWWLPSIRGRLEAPKYRVLSWDQPSVRNPEPPAAPEA